MSPTALLVSQFVTNRAECCCQCCLFLRSACAIRWELCRRVVCVTPLPSFFFYWFLCRDRRTHTKTTWIRCHPPHVHGRMTRDDGRMTAASRPQVNSTALQSLQHCDPDRCSTMTVAFRPQVMSTALAQAERCPSHEARASANLLTKVTPCHPHRYVTEVKSRCCTDAKKRTCSNGLGCLSAP